MKLLKLGLYFEAKEIDQIAGQFSKMASTEESFGSFAKGKGKTKGMGMDVDNDTDMDMDMEKEPELPASDAITAELGAVLSKSPSHAARPMP